MTVEVSLLEVNFIYILVKLFHHQRHKEHKVTKGSIKISYNVILCVLRDLCGFLNFLFFGLLKQIGIQLEFELYGRRRHGQRSRLYIENKN